MIMENKKCYGHATFSRVKIKNCSRFLVIHKQLLKRIVYVRAQNKGQVFGRALECAWAINSNQRTMQWSSLLLMAPRWYHKTISCNWMYWSDWIFLNLMLSSCTGLFSWIRRFLPLEPWANEIEMYLLLNKKNKTNRQGSRKKMYST